MRMLHATAFRNLPNITDIGIKVRKAKCAVRTIYLVAPSYFAKAVEHAAKRHKLKPEQIAVIVVDVPRGWLRKGKRKGLWHTNGRDVPPSRIVEFYGISRHERRV